MNLTQPTIPPGSEPGPGASIAELKVLVRGFTATEHRLLDATVKLSQRRPPHIVLVAETDAAQADVLMLDSHDPAAVQWAAAQPWLAQKPAIWAGPRQVPLGHTVIERHVQWPILPVLLYRALEQYGVRRAPAAREMPTAGAAELRILVVDDSLAVRAHLRSLLESQHMHVVEADSAEAGIAAAAREPFACVLMDVLMPGTDGFEACRRIKAAARSGAALPVVMLTSKASPFDRVRGKMAGCDSYLTKPVDPAQLNEVIARVAAAAAPGRAASRPAGAMTPFQIQSQPT